MLKRSLFLMAFLFVNSAYTLANTTLEEHYLNAASSPSEEATSLICESISEKLTKATYPHQENEYRLCMERYKREILNEMGITQDKIDAGAQVSDYGFDSPEVKALIQNHGFTETCSVNENRTVRFGTLSNGRFNTATNGIYKKYCMHQLMDFLGGKVYEKSFQSLESKDWGVSWNETVNSTPEQTLREFINKK